MQGTRLLFFVSVIWNYPLFCAEALQGNAFGTNVNACLFESWRNRTNPVLSEGVNCSSMERTGLCYGIKKQTLFAVCYNNNTLIPEFSAHIVEPVYGKRSGGRARWRNEAGQHGKFCAGTPDKGGRRGNCPPCPLSGGARGAKVPFRFITTDLINCKFK